MKVESLDFHSVLANKWHGHIERVVGFGWFFSLCSMEHWCPNQIINQLLKLNPMKSNQFWMVLKSLFTIVTDWHRNHWANTNASYLFEKPLESSRNIPVKWSSMGAHLPQNNAKSNHITYEQSIYYQKSNPLIWPLKSSGTADFRSKITRIFFISITN